MAVVVASATAVTMIAASAAVALVGARVIATGVFIRTLVVGPRTVINTAHCEVKTAVNYDPE
jgi:hypothetical protein